MPNSKFISDKMEKALEDMRRERDIVQVVVGKVGAGKSYSSLRSVMSHTYDIEYDDLTDPQLDTSPPKEPETPEIKSRFQIIAQNIKKRN